MAYASELCDFQSVIIHQDEESEHISTDPALGISYHSNDQSNESIESLPDPSPILTGQTSRCIKSRPSSPPRLSATHKSIELTSGIMYRQTSQSYSFFHRQETMDSGVSGMSAMTDHPSQASTVDEEPTPTPYTSHFTSATSANPDSDNFTSTMANHDSDNTLHFTNFASFEPASFEPNHYSQSGTVLVDEQYIQSTDATDLQSQNTVEIHSQNTLDIQSSSVMSDHTSSSTSSNPEQRRTFSYENRTPEYRTPEPDPHILESERVRQKLLGRMSWHNSANSPRSTNQRSNSGSCIVDHGAKEQWVSLSDTEVDCLNVVDSTSKVNLSDFANDRRAFDTWMACCDVHDEKLGYFGALYPLLCTLFAEKTKCSRVPLPSDLEEVIIRFGAAKTALSQLSEVHNPRGTSIFTSDHPGIAHRQNSYPPMTPPDSPSINKRKHRPYYDDGVGTSCHFAKVSATNQLPFGHSHSIRMSHDGMSGMGHSKSFSFGGGSPRNKKEQFVVTVPQDGFFKFWQWFMECCKVVRELAHLWDTSDQFVLRCDLFCGREKCQEILEEAPPGTFMIRLSSVIKGGVVLSYVEPTYSDTDRQFKHTILIRRGSHQYELKKKKKKKKGNSTKPQLTTISALVRSFVKIKFLFSPNCLVPKKNVF